MAALGSTIKDKLINHLMGGTTYTKPTSVKLALYHSNVTAADVGMEVSGGSYARQTITVTASTGGEGSISNSVAVTFTGMPDCTSNPITHAAVRDGSSGELLLFGPLASPKSPSAGGTVTIAVGELVLSIS